MYGRRTSCAIAAMSRLAEMHGGDPARLSAMDIAQSRDFPQPMIAKILSILGQAGLVTSVPGPGGGFSLARDPGEITLHDVFRLFERDTSVLQCPFGGGVCGGGDEPCPLHDRLSAVQEAMDRLLYDTTFAVFREPPHATK